MTSHPDDKYIITEKLLREIIYFAYVDPKDDDKIHEGIKDAVKIIRSQSYNPITDQGEVINDVEQYIQKHSWISSPGFITAVSQKPLLKFIQTLRIPPHPNHPPAHKIRR